MAFRYLTIVVIMMKKCLPPYLF